jgi:hypothetical protein
MEKVGHTGGNAGQGWEVPSGAIALAAVAMWAASPLAGAQEAPLPPEGVMVAEARMEPPVRVQVQTSSVPRLDAQDSGFQAPRVDVSVFPANAYGLGAVVGVSGFTARQPQALGLAPRGTNVDFGLRWTHKLQSQHQIDVTAWRRMNTADDAYSLIQNREPVYGARVEMNIKPAKVSFMGLEKAFLGFQLESGAKISIKRKDGRPMIYYRTTF